MSKAPQRQSDREATRARLQIWDDAAPALEEQRWRELMALTDEKALALTKALFGRKLDHIPVRPSSGLVEQQALFHRRRQK